MVRICYPRNLELWHLTIFWAEPWLVLGS